MSRQQAILDVQESIKHALGTAEHAFCEGDLRRLERLQEQTRRTRESNSSPTRESIVRLACVYAGNVLYGDYPQPEIRYIRELVHALKTLNHADDYRDIVKVRLSLHLALLAQLVKWPDIAQEAAAKAVDALHGLTHEQRGTAWLVESEVSTQPDKGGALRMALAAFQQMPNSKSKWLTLLRTHTRLADRYRFSGQPFYSRWHTWCSKVIKLRLMIGLRCQSRDLKNACTNRVPPTLRNI